LRSRLLRRGVTLGAGAAALGFGEVAAAALPVALVRETVRAAALFAAGAGVGGIASPAALALAEGVLKMMALDRFKAIVAALVLLAVLGTGAGLLVSRTLAGGQAEAPQGVAAGTARPAEAAAPPKKEALRYGGKTFDEWHLVLTTDLKPEVRVEAIKALSTFGANGYGHEAAAAVVELMRQYDVKQTDADDEKVVEAARNGLAKIGAPAEPALVEELKKGKPNGRRFALSALQRFREPGKAVVSAVVERLKDEHQNIRAWAVATLREIDREGASAAALGDVLVNDPELRVAAAEVLARFGAKAKPALPQLLQAAKDFPATRYYAIVALRKIKPEAGTVLPVIIEALKGEDQNARLEAIAYIQDLGPEAKDAVKPLIAAWDRTNDVGEHTWMANAFGSIGPAAKEALPRLARVRDENTPWGAGRNGAGVSIRELVTAAQKAISQIDK
jgi:hypothetical protein